LFVLLFYFWFLFFCFFTFYFLWICGFKKKHFGQFYINIQRLINPWAKGIPKMWGWTWLPPQCLKPFIKKKMPIFKFYLVLAYYTRFWQICTKVLANIYEGITYYVKLEVINIIFWNTYEIPLLLVSLYQCY
jgi:hypothetical protein